MTQFVQNQKNGETPPVEVTIVTQLLYHELCLAYYT